MSNHRESAVADLGSHHAVLRIGCVGVVLAVEILAVSTRFDSAQSSHFEPFVAAMVSRAGEFGRLLVWVVASVGLFAGNPLLRSISAIRQRTTRITAVCLLAHAATFASFWYSSVCLFEPCQSWQERSSGLIALLWVALGIATSATCLSIAVHVRYWRSIAASNAKQIAVGVVTGVLAWIAGEYITRLWESLAAGTFWMVAKLLQFCAIDITWNSARLVIGTEGFSVRIAPECSGIEGIGLTLVFVASYLWIYRADFRFPAVLSVIPLAMLAAWAANGVRIAALIIIGDRASPTLALNGFHSQAGALLFVVIGLAAVGATRRIAGLTRYNAKLRRSSPAAPWILPLLAILAVTTATKAVAIGFDWLYPLRVMIVAAVLFAYRKRYTRENWGWDWVAAGIGIAVFGVWIALEPITIHSASPRGDGVWGSGVIAGLVWIAFRIVGSVVTMPLAEELAFRGFLARRLISKDFETVSFKAVTFLSFTVPSLAFGALHGRWLAGTIAGAAFALAVVRRGRFCDAVVAHGTANLLLCIYVLTTGNWQLW